MDLGALQQGPGTQSTELISWVVLKHPSRSGSVSRKSAMCKCVDPSEHRSCVLCVPQLRALISVGWSSRCGDPPQWLKALRLCRTWTFESCSLSFSLSHDDFLMLPILSICISACSHPCHICVGHLTKAPWGPANLFPFRRPDDHEAHFQKGDYI